MESTYSSDLNGTALEAYVPRANFLAVEHRQNRFPRTVAYALTARIMTARSSALVRCSKIGGRGREADRARERVHRRHRRGEIRFPM